MNRMLIACCAVMALFECRVYGQQADIRLNPELGVQADESTAGVDFPDYPFLKMESNAISLNGADWSALCRRLGGADSSVVRVLHIGDSHVQAEGATSRTRRILQARYGNAGRGLTAPLRLAGTNSPNDYSIRSSSQFSASRLLKRPWSTEMGFSGVAVRPAHMRFDITVNCGEAFDRLCLHTIGAAIEVESTSPDIMAGFISPADGMTDVLLTHPTTEITLNLLSAGTTDLTAIELMNGSAGLLYSAIGNNGATFASYSSIPGFGESVARLRPDLIVLSLGTNEAFGRFTDDGLRAEIHSLVSELQRSCPDAVFLLTTPQECYRRSYTRRGKGRRRRRVRSYSVNTNVRRVRDIVAAYAADHSIALYDWYDVAGGAGIAQKWLATRLMNTDRIHLTWDGYHLMGDLMGDALLRAFDTINDTENESAATY